MAINPEYPSSSIQGRPPEVPNPRHSMEDSVSPGMVMGGNARPISPRLVAAFRESARLALQKLENDGLVQLEPDEGGTPAT